MTTDNCTCLTEARGVDVRTADYIAKERADAKWRAEKLGWVVLSTEEYDGMAGFLAVHGACGFSLGEPTPSPDVTVTYSNTEPAVAAAEA